MVVPISLQIALRSAGGVALIHSFKFMSES